MCLLYRCGRIIGLFCRHLARVPDYLWVAEDGMKMQGYCNSTLWDTAFAVQAITATGLGSEFTQCLNKAMSAIDEAQVYKCQQDFLIPKHNSAIRLILEA